jgi:hypothetical protein
MSDNYTTRGHYRYTITPLGVNRRKKYLVLFLVITLVATVGIIYQICTSGVLAENNLQVSQQMLTRINLARQANNLPPVSLSPKLTNDAIKISREVRISPRGYLSGKGQKSAGGTNIFVIPKMSWAISVYDYQQQIFDTLENNDNFFHNNILDRAFDSVGVGVTGDGYNYYIVTMWDKSA